jgi:hypothetical protein
VHLKNFDGQTVKSSLIDRRVHFYTKSKLIRQFIHFVNPGIETTTNCTASVASVIFYGIIASKQ